MLMIWLLPVFLAVLPVVQSACGGSHTLSSSSEVYSISTYGYPNKHPPRANCKWTISAPKSAKGIKLDCSYNIYHYGNCNYSSFSYSDNGSIQKKCGTDTFKKVISARSTTITFKSSLNYNPYFKGFLCKISYTKSEKPNQSDSAIQPLDKTCRCGRKKGTRIVGGNEATPNEYPWQALIKTKSGVQFCGGSLISDQYILTAAHCLIGKRPSQILVTLGEHDYSTSDKYATDYEASVIIYHKSYNNNRYYANDIALIKLAKPASISFIVSPICLPINYKNFNFEGKTGTVTGWGLTKDGDRSTKSKVLNEVDLAFLNHEKCAREHIWHLGQVSKKQICGYKENKGPCHGDSGGPFVWGNDKNYYFQIGIVSWGGKCAGRHAAGVFTRVTEYINWINVNTGSTKFCVK